MSEHETVTDEVEELERPFRVFEMAGEPPFKLKDEGMDILGLHYGMFERALLQNISPKGAILGVVDLGKYGKMYGEWYDPKTGPRFDVVLAAAGMGEEQAARYATMYESQLSFQFSRMGSRLVFQNHTGNWGGKGLGMPYSYDIAAIAPVEMIDAVVNDLPSTYPAFKMPFYMAVAEASADAYRRAAEEVGFKVVVVDEETYASAGGGIMQPGSPVPEAVTALAVDAYDDPAVGAIVLPPSAAPSHPWFRFVPLRDVVEIDVGKAAIHHLIRFDDRAAPVYNSATKAVQLPSNYRVEYAPRPEHEFYQRVLQLQELLPYVQAAGFEPTGNVGVGSGRAYASQVTVAKLVSLAQRKENAGRPVADLKADGVRPGYGALVLGASVIEISPLAGQDGDSTLVLKLNQSPRQDKYVAIKLWSAFHAGGSLGRPDPTGTVAYQGVVVSSKRAGDGIYTHRVLRGPLMSDSPGLEGMVFKPFLGGLGPIETSFLLTDSIVTFDLVATQGELYKSLQSSSRPREPGWLDHTGQLVDEGVSVGYRDIVWCEVKLNIVKAWTRVGLEGLDFLSGGAGVIKPFPDPVRASYTALGEELNGEYFSIVDLETPWTVPSQPVTQLEVFSRYRKAKEKACKKNDFLDQPYSAGRTWGQAQRELEKRGKLSSCYMVGWSTAVVDDPKLELPVRVVLVDATDTAAAYAEVDWGDGKGRQRVEPGDYDKVGYWLKSGVPYTGPLSVVRQGAGLDHDLDVDEDLTTFDNDFWSSPNSKGWGVGAANGTVFAAEAYSQAGFADLTTMVGEAPIKAALASVNLFGHTGAQLDLVFKKLRKDVPAAVLSRGRKIATTNR